MIDQITLLVLTKNEAPNIGRTLERVRWANDIVVVDSFSEDRTLEIVSRFPQVRVFQRQFDCLASQCNFGLTETRIETDWVMSLDADYVLTPELVAEIGALQPSADVVGLRAGFTYCAFGRPLRSGIYPPVTVLFRKSQAFYKQDGHAHRVIIDGRIEDLRAPILHDDRKPISRWLNSQASYARLEARKILSSDPGSLAWPDRVRGWRVVAPMAILFYCLIVRGGVLDGWAGFYYAFQRMLAELMLSLYLIDHSLRNKQGDQQGWNRDAG
jgi:glycosyltransferase involved in cell wall biosynthesis